MQYKATIEANKKKFAYTFITDEIDSNKRYELCLSRVKERLKIKGESISNVIILSIQPDDQKDNFGSNPFKGTPFSDIFNGFGK